MEVILSQGPDEDMSLVLYKIIAIANTWSFGSLALHYKPSVLIWFQRTNIDCDSGTAWTSTLARVKLLLRREC